MHPVCLASWRTTACAWSRFPTASTPRATEARQARDAISNVRVPAIPINSVISSNASDMIGEAPRARSAFAVNSRTTELVKDSTKGVVSLKVWKSVQTRSAVVYIRRTGESERERAETSETRENATSPHRDYPARLGLTSEELFCSCSFVTVPGLPD